MHARFVPGFLPAAVLSSVAVLASGEAVQQSSRAGVVLGTVLDRAGRPLVSLDPDAFVIEEEGMRREILSVHVADYPVVLLLDTSSSSPPDFNVIRAAARRFVDRLGEERAVRVQTIGGRPEALASFEDDRSRVLDALEAVQPLAGPLAPLASLAAAARTVRALELPFSAFVLVWNPLAGQQAAAEDPSLAGEVFDSRAVVHVVGRSDAAGAAASALRDDERLLRDVARRSGGQFMPIYSMGSYVAALDRLADRLAAELMIEYLVPPDAPLASASVQVGVKVPGARVLGIRIYR